MIQALFVLWRESAEALLVIGILHAWLRRHGDARHALRWLWAGVAAGCGLSALFAAALLGLFASLAGEALEWVQLGMMLLASGLIVHMAVWMRRQGPQLRRSLETGLAGRAGPGVALLAALAVAREGSETVVFLYGLGLERLPVGQLALTLLLGLALAAATYWLLQHGGRRLQWRTFFRISETLLLLLGGALLLAAVEKLTMLGHLPTLVDELWDSSWLLDDGGDFGRLLAGFTGYRTHPALSPLLALAGYWLLALAWLRRSSRA
ncbi:FTR1 family iron permease [Chitinimonas koreensis]|uniref:FTR1 family iron permease n=1 Tax=Chitinimonas koreensis TaxID=356302 RepID=UPI0004067F31|nr:FTR1 family protein [Chitinimonas koreensis]QNM95135.1 FTR1 family protein [Chitinimonas koreensis]